MLQLRPLIGAAAVLLAASSFASSAEVLEQVPRDALGFIVVRNLAEFDAKASLVLGAVGSRLPGPLALLKSIAGIQAGLDERRDLMIVLLPPESDSERFSLALWLPVSDYDALVHSLDGDPGRRVAAVTLAGEDLLVVREDEWAVVMDPDQRNRLELLRETKPVPPPQLVDWSDWVAANDATVVVLPSGMKMLWSFAEREKLFEPLSPTQPVPTAQGLFGQGRLPTSAADSWPVMRDWYRTTFAERPEIARWAARAEGAACGLRLEQAGNSVLGVRLAVDAEALPETSASASTAVEQVPYVYSSGDFVLTGGGQVSPRWVVPAVAPYVRQVANDLTNNYGIPVAEEDVAKFRAGVEGAIAEVQTFAVLTRPGAPDEAVFTNNFLALRVTNAKRFLNVASECIRLWNKMLDKPQAAMKLIFNPREFSVADRSGTEYSIDMASAVNAPAIPEARASMEKLFGPGALFRLQMIAIDETTVLLAAATEKQVAQVIEEMTKRPLRVSDPGELRATLELLSPDHAWFVCVSPSGYTSWLKRQMDAVLGAVIGGPIVPQFPVSPPLGFAGNVHGNVIWVEAAVPIQTLRGAGRFWRP